MPNLSVTITIQDPSFGTITTSLEDAEHDVLLLVQERTARTIAEREAEGAAQP